MPVESENNVVFSIDRSLGLWYFVFKQMGFTPFGVGFTLFLVPVVDYG
jgi:hypothetical protein